MLKVSTRLLKETTRQPFVVSLKKGKIKISLHPFSKTLIIGLVEAWMSWNTNQSDVTKIIRELNVNAI